MGIECNKLNYQMTRSGRRDNQKLQLRKQQPQSQKEILREINEARSILSKEI